MGPRTQGPGGGMNGSVVSLPSDDSSVAGYPWSSSPEAPGRVQSRVESRPPPPSLRGLRRRVRGTRQGSVQGWGPKKRGRGSLTDGGKEPQGFGPNMGDPGGRKVGSRGRGQTSSRDPGGRGELSPLLDMIL